MNSASVTGVPTGLVVPLIWQAGVPNWRAVHFLEELNVKHGLLARTFLSHRGSEGKIILIQSKLFAFVLGYGL